MDYPEQHYDTIIDTLINTFGEVLSRDVLYSIVASFNGDLEESANAIMNITMDENNTENAPPDLNQVNENLANEAQAGPEYVSPSYMFDTGSAEQNAQEPKIDNNLQPALSYANASRSLKPPYHHQVQQATATITPSKTQFYQTEQLRRILSYHDDGARTLVLMRGLPGSGKSHLARKIVDAIYHTKNKHYDTHIFSTDDYFMRNGFYVYDKSRLQDAHEWNQKRASEAITRGVSPVIIDNTNIEFWEMEFYVIKGVKNGYIIEVVEPNTPWAKKANQLCRKTTHNVPVALIRKKLENFQSGIDGDYLMNLFKLFYLPFNKPPVLRTIPPFEREESMNSDNFVTENAYVSNISEVKENYHETPQCSLSEITVVAPAIKDYAELTQSNEKISGDTDVKTLELTEPIASSSESATFISSHLDKFVEIQKCLEEMERVEKEWENGEDWDNSSKTKSQDSKTFNFTNSKPQRQLNTPMKSDTTETLSDEVCQDWSKGSMFLQQCGESSHSTQIEPSLSDEKNISSSTEYSGTKISISKNEPMPTDSVEKLIISDKVCQDWSRCSMFLPSWGENSHSIQIEPPQSVVEKKTSSTSIEYGDTDISTSKNPFKIVNATPRNINENHVTVNQKKMTAKWMLDKSTSTNNNEILTDNFRCQNEEQHFAAFRKLFKNIARSELRDIFDNCCGDVNWAVEIVMDGGVVSKQLDIADGNEHSDTEGDAQNDDELCQCLSAYDIIPHNNNASSPSMIEESHNLIENTPSSSRTRGRKEHLVSETSMQLKRQIEQNIVISDNHYSEHCLKIRKFRRGELGDFSDYNDGIPLINNQQSNTETSEVTANENQVTSSSPLQNPFSYNSTPSTSRVDNINSEMSDEDSPVYEDIERTININLGKEFVAQLDEYFGRNNMEYPPTIVPKINIPISLLNEINALWMESLMNQLEEDAKQSEIMLHQDEEFARQLVIKEAEMNQAGKEPEVPDFKEIMDMDFALSLYQKDVAEWRNCMPDDMAAKLTRDKLYNLFPDVSKDVLSELLMAHDNNFQQTVEGLLISTGKSDILEKKNGVSKFVMEKEMERQERLLEEQRQAVSEVEWPLLIQQSEPVDMAAVQHYRDEAEKHLKSRNMNYQRAQDYIRRGITQVATHYSEIAAFHKKKYEMASSMAAASLMQVHAANCSDNATIDLHYLRVAEAKETLDLFIDTHIQKLRETQDKNGLKSHTLFFITGRGLHSNGRPRVKPAVKKRLAERGIAFSERNPGLLTAKVCANDKLTHQVP